MSASHSNSDGAKDNPVFGHSNSMWTENYSNDIFGGADIASSFLAVDPREVRRAETAPMVLTIFGDDGILCVGDAVDKVQSGEEYRYTEEYHLLYYSKVPRDPRMPPPLTQRRVMMAGGAKDARERAAAATQMGLPSSASNALMRGPLECIDDAKSAATLEQQEEEEQVSATLSRLTTTAHGDGALGSTAGQKISPDGVVGDERASAARRASQQHSHSLLSVLHPDGARSVPHPSSHHPQSSSNLPSNHSLRSTTHTGVSASGAAAILPTGAVHHIHAPDHHPYDSPNDSTNHANSVSSEGGGDMVGNGYSQLHTSDSVGRAGISNGEEDCASAVASSQTQLSYSVTSTHRNQPYSFRGSSTMAIPAVVRTNAGAAGRVTVPYLNEAEISTVASAPNTAIPHKQQIHTQTHQHQISHQRQRQQQQQLPPLLLQQAPPQPALSSHKRTLGENMRSANQTNRNRYGTHAMSLVGGTNTVSAAGDGDAGVSMPMGQVPDYASIRGSVFKLSKDHDNSRFVQRLLDRSENVYPIGEEVLAHFEELANDVFGNYVIQKLFFSLRLLINTEEDEKKQSGAGAIAGQESLTALQAMMNGLVNCVRGNMRRYAFEMYSCRVMQKALENMPVESLLEIIHEIDDCITDCVFDHNANHVIQKIIELCPGRCQYIVDAFLPKLRELSCHTYGCRVLQRVFEECHDVEGIDIRPLTEAVLAHLSEFTIHQYGNYVVQHSIINASEELRHRLIAALIPNLYAFSCSKFGSNVAEKVVTLADEAERNEIINTVTCQRGDGHHNNDLVCMMQDTYANYVVQRFLESASAEQRRRIGQLVLPYVASIDSSVYGRHLLRKIEVLGVLSAEMLLQHGIDFAQAQPNNNSDNNSHHNSYNNHNMRGGGGASHHGAQSNYSHSNLTPMRYHNRSNANSMSVYHGHKNAQDSNSGMTNSPMLETGVMANPRRGRAARGHVDRSSSYTMYDTANHARNFGKDKYPAASAKNRMGKWVHVSPQGQFVPHVSPPQQRPGGNHTNSSHNSNTADYPQYANYNGVGTATAGAANASFTPWGGGGGGVTGDTMPATEMPMMYASSSQGLQSFSALSGLPSSLYSTAPVTGYDTAASPYPSAPPPPPPPPPPPQQQQQQHQPELHVSASPSFSMMPNMSLGAGAGPEMGSAHLFTHAAMPMDESVMPGLNHANPSRRTRRPVAAGAMRNNGNRNTNNNNDNNARQQQPSSTGARWPLYPRTMPANDNNNSSNTNAAADAVTAVNYPPMEFNKPYAALPNSSYSIMLPSGEGNTETAGSTAMNSELAMRTSLSTMLYSPVGYTTTTNTNTAASAPQPTTATNASTAALMTTPEWSTQAMGFYTSGTARSGYLATMPHSAMSLPSSQMLPR